MNSSAYSLDDVVIGVTYFFSSITIIIIYVPFLIVLWSDEQIKNHSCIRLMFHLGISDCLQLAGFICMGFWSFTGIAYDLPHWINRGVIAVLTQSSWFSYILFIHLTAINRCAVQCFSATWQDRLFSYKRTTFWIYFGWFFAWGVVAAELSPWAGCLIYYPETFVFYFDFNPRFYNLPKFMTFNIVMCVVNLGSTCICYGITLFSVHRELASVGVSVTDDSKKMERSLLKQAVIICAFMMLTDQYWHNISKWTCPLIGIYCFMMGGMLHIINAAINPIIYITINKTLWNKVKERFLPTPPGTATVHTMTRTVRNKTEPNANSL